MRIPILENINSSKLFVFCLALLAPLNIFFSGTSFEITPVVKVFFRTSPVKKVGN